MWLDNFLRAKPVIDFEPNTGKYTVVGKDEIPEGVALVHIEDKLHGDYLDEADEMHAKFGRGAGSSAKKFFRYWMPDNVRFHFQDSDGKYIEIDGKRYATLEDAVDPAGHPIDGHKQFSVFEPEGQLIYRHIYDQTPYLTAYMMDFSFPSPELADWDFFVALQGSFEYMRENAHKHHSLDPASASMNESVPAGRACPRAGWWFTPAKQASRRYFKQGDVFPEFEGGAYGATFWQWSPDQSCPSL
jgi:hypothetical protein